jgi:hypothetical protein
LAVDLLDGAAHALRAGEKAGALSMGAVEVIPAVEEALPDLEQAVRALARAEARLPSITWQALPWRVRQPLEPVQRLPQARVLLEAGLGLARHLPQLAGGSGERRYLILAQDQGELRATGGFIGNYGQLVLQDGVVTDFQFQDVYALDLPYHRATGGPPLHPIFRRYLPEATWWGLRDSNISPDFPTAAKEAERLFVAEGGGPAVDGVIALTIDSLSVLLKTLGPVQMTEFGETVTADNVEEKIRYYQYNVPPPQVLESLGIDRWQRKLFTALLAQAVFQRIGDLGPTDLLPLLESGEELLRTKAVQVYFNDPDLQKAALLGDFAGQVKDAWGDYLFVVDSNLSGNKANIYVKQSVQYGVQLREEGAALARLTIHYDYTSPGNIYQGMIKRDFYGDYLRVYVPYGSVLLGSEGVDEEVQTSWELGKTVFSTFLKIRPGTEKTVTLRYMLPFLITSWTEGDAGLPTGRQGRYQLTLQKQAGTDITSVQVGVELPEGTEVIQPAPFQVRDGQPFFEGALDRDLLLNFRLKGP